MTELFQAHKSREPKKENETYRTPTCPMSTNDNQLKNQPLDMYQGQLFGYNIPMVQTFFLKNPLQGEGCAGRYSTCSNFSTWPLE